MPNDPFYWAVDAALTEFEKTAPQDGFVGGKGLDILAVGVYVPDIISGVIPDDEDI